MFASSENTEAGDAKAVVLSCLMVSIRRTTTQVVLVVGATLALGVPTQTRAEDLYAPPEPLAGARHSRCCGNGYRDSSRLCSLEVPDKQATELFRLLPAQAFARQPRATTRVLASGAFGIKVSPDRRTIAIVTRNRGVKLQPGGQVGNGLVQSVEFSKDGQYVALKNEDASLEVIRLRDTRLLGTLEHVEGFAFVNAGEIAVHQGCQFAVARLDTPLVAQPLGRTACGVTLFIAPDLSRMLLASQSIIRRGTFQAYSAISSVDVRRAEWSSLLRFGPEIEFLAPRVSDDGRIVCAERAFGTLFNLECSRNGESSHVIHHGVSHVFEFDPSGRYLLFEGAAQGREKMILVADFRQRSVRVVAPSEGRDARWVDDGRRVIAHGRAQAEVFDLVERWARPLGNPKEEWQGSWRYPGSSTQIAVGQDVGAGRIVHTVSLPAPRGGT